MSHSACVCPYSTHILPVMGWCVGRKCTVSFRFLSDCRFILFFFFLRGSARMQSHEYKTYTANSEVSGPGGEETLLLFHFKPVSLTDDFWAPHHFCLSPPPPALHFFLPIVFMIWSVGITLQDGLQSASVFYSKPSVELFFSFLAFKRKLCIFRQSFFYVS